MALERVVLLRVAVDRGADLLGGQVPVGGQQQDDYGQGAVRVLRFDIGVLPFVVCR
jgi:hypothetical protein